MGWQASLLLACLVSGALMLWLGTRKRANRRRRGVLGEPSPACRRNGTEAVGP